MKSIIKDVQLIQRYSPEMGGVFGINDLQAITGIISPVLLHRRIIQLEKAQLISRFTRGYYVTPNFNAEALSARISQESYLSFGTILSKNLMIGSIPDATLYAVKTGRNRTYQSPQKRLIYLGISPKYYFGFTISNGIRFATPEKAWLDTLYFYLKGTKFSFNIYEDIDISRLNRKTIYSWLEIYENKKFITFVKGFLND